jgi:thiol-disulfide isomerase/thioredoxin
MVLSALAGQIARAELKVGDAAPPLKIKDWVRGEAVDLAKDAAKKIHIVEFWATWCPPCKASVPLLTEFQSKYKKDLTIIGVTESDPYRNSGTAIKDFVKERGKEMDYTVAIDDDGVTSKAYMGEEEVGIPQAFLVGKDGRVVWVGSPLDPALEKVIPDVIAGKYDVTAAKKAAAVEEEVGKRFQTLEMAYQLGQTQAVWEGVVDILRIDPANELAMQILTSLYVDDPKKADAYRSAITSHIEKNKTNAAAMFALATTLCEHEDYSTRSPDLAISAAKAAYEASGQRDQAAVEIYARALFQIGAVDRAASLQKDAVTLAPESGREGPQRVLAYFELCKKLQASN